MTGDGGPRHRRRYLERSRRQRLAVTASVAVAVLVAAVLLAVRPGATADVRSAGSGTSATTTTAPAGGSPVRIASASASLAAGTSSTAVPPTTTRPPTTTTTTTTAPTTTTAAPATTTTTAPAPAVTTTTEPRPASSGCGGALPAQLSSTGGGTQLVTVEASGYGTTDATLTAWARSGSCWRVAYGPFAARLGWSGLETASEKREGDGGTPEGLYGFGPVVYGNEGDPGVHYAYHRLVCGDWWDEDPQSPQYNLFVHWPCGSTPPFAQGAAGSGSEALWTETGAYPWFAVIQYNTDRTPYKGSAIFLHYGLASPTAGCVSIGMSELREVLDWLQPADSPAIVIGTDADITGY